MNFQVGDAIRTVEIVCLKIMREDIVANELLMDVPRRAEWTVLLLRT
jgi:hypothetical protein